MKRFFGILLAVLLAASLAACAAAEKPEETRSETVFRATVLSIGNGAMVVEPVEGAEELRSADQISVALEHMPASPEPQVGDTVEITYNGEIMETYPAQLGEVYGITVAEAARAPEAPAEEPEEEPAEEPAEEPPAVNPDEPVHVEYGYDDAVYMALDVPAGWDYEIHTREETEKEDGLYTCSIAFWPQEEPEMVFELSHWTAFGMCGTGVTIEELTLESGLSGWKYTEESDGTVWLTVVLEVPQTEAGGSYVISASPERALWDRYEDDFLEILETVQAGVTE